jgi:hypothetical protein
MNFKLASATFFLQNTKKTAIQDEKYIKEEILINLMHYFPFTA